jgi:hypothetical protein
VARLLNRYCQCVPQLRLLRHSEQAVLPHSQRGQGSQARREASACGSIGIESVTVSPSVNGFRLGYPYQWCKSVPANWWRQGMTGSAKAHYDGIVAFSQNDFGKT